MIKHHSIKKKNINKTTKPEKVKGKNVSDKEPSVDVSFISLFSSGNLGCVTDLPPQHRTNQRHQVCVPFVTLSFITRTAGALNRIAGRETVWMSAFHKRM